MFHPVHEAVECPGKRGFHLDPLSKARAGRTLVSGLFHLACQEDPSHCRGESLLVWVVSHSQCVLKETQNSLSFYSPSLLYE